MRFLLVLLLALAAGPAAGQVAPVGSVSVAAKMESPAGMIGSPSIWLPEFDAGLPLSAAVVFGVGSTGAPVAVAFDGGVIPLTIFFDRTYRDPKQPTNQDWMLITNTAVGYGLSVQGRARSVLTMSAYRYFAFDGVSELDEVSAPSPPAPRLGSDLATSIEPGHLIFTAYDTKLNGYHLSVFDGGVSYDTNFTGGGTSGNQAVFNETINVVTGIPGGDMLVGTRAGQQLDAGAVYSVNRSLKQSSIKTLIQGYPVGKTLDGLAVYHANDVGDGGSADYGLVASEHQLLLFQLKPTFALIDYILIQPSPFHLSYIGAIDPEGLAVSNLPIGPYDKGVVVVQARGGIVAFLRWDDIVAAVDAGLPIDTSFDPRTYSTNSTANYDGGLNIPPLSSGIGDMPTTGCGGNGGISAGIVMLVGLAGLARRRR